MAETLGIVAFPLFIGASLVLGVRLLLLAWRTRELPELAMGLNLLVAGAVGYAVLLLAESLRMLGAWAGAGSFAGVTAIAIGTAAIGVFTHRVFHRGSSVSRAALAGLCLWLVLGVVGSWEIHIEGDRTGVEAWLGRWGPNLGVLAAYAWSGVEALRWFARLRRRVEIGLADPLVANRMLLWGLGSCGIGAVALLHLGASLVGHRDLPPSLVGVAAVLVLITAVAEWLAFFPPPAYRKRFAPQP